MGRAAVVATRLPNETEGVTMVDRQRPRLGGPGPSFPDEVPVHTPMAAANPDGGPQSKPGTEVALVGAYERAGGGVPFDPADRRFLSPALRLCTVGLLLILALGGVLALAAGVFG